MPLALLVQPLALLHPSEEPIEVTYLSLLVMMSICWLLRMKKLQVVALTFASSYAKLNQSRINHLYYKSSMVYCKLMLKARAVRKETNSYNGPPHLSI